MYQDCIGTSMIPLIDYLRSKESIQCEIVKCLAELRNFNETASTVRMKS